MQGTIRPQKIMRHEIDNRFLVQKLAIIRS